LGILMLIKVFFV